MNQSLDLSDVETVANRIKKMIDDGNPSNVILPNVVTLLDLIDKLKEEK